MSLFIFMHNNIKRFSYTALCALTVSFCLATSSISDKEYINTLSEISTLLKTRKFSDIPLELQNEIKIFYKRHAQNEQQENDRLIRDIEFRLIKLNKKEQLAIGRAIWYIIKKGYGISTAVTKASGSFGVRDGKVERGTRAVFPKGYFISLQESKNAETVIELVKL